MWTQKINKKCSQGYSFCSLCELQHKKPRIFDKPLISFFSFPFSGGGTIPCPQLYTLNFPRYYTWFRYFWWRILTGTAGIFQVWEISINKWLSASLSCLPYTRKLKHCKFLVWKFLTHQFNYNLVSYCPHKWTPSKYTLLKGSGFIWRYYIFWLALRMP